MSKCLILMISVLPACAAYAAEPEPSRPITWADEHPEVVANNARPTIPWPCEKIETDLGYCHQPSVVIDSSGELYAEGSHGRIFHSVDGGRKWSRLCSVPPLFEVPEGRKPFAQMMTGLGVTPMGTLLGCWWCGYSASGERSPEEHTLDYALWVTRSEDRGRTWSASPLFEAPPGEKVGGGKMRVAVMPDGRLMIQTSSTAQSRPDRPVTHAEQVHHGHVFVSADDGRTWSREGYLGDHTNEVEKYGFFEPRLAQ